MTITRTPGNPGRSQIVEYNGMVTCVGTGPDTIQGMKGQTQQVLAKIDGYLAAAGSDKSKLLSALILIADIGLRPRMNKVWQAWIDPRNPPTRACVGVQFEGQTNVEIMVVAKK